MAHLDQTTERDDEIDLTQLFGMLWRGKWLIGLCAFLALCFGIVYAYRLATPLYPAHVTVVMEDAQPQVLGDIGSLLAGGGVEQGSTAKEVEIIRSRNLIETLVETLGLIEDPEFNSTLRTPNPYHPVVLIKGLLGVVEPELSEAQIRNAVIDSVLEVVSASSPRDAPVITISVTTTSADKSAHIANVLADLYIQDQLEVKFAALAQASRFLSDRAADMKVELEDAEAAIKDFNAQTNLVSMEALTGLSIQLKELRARKEDIAEKVARVEEARAALEAVSAEKDPLILSAAAGGALERELRDWEAGRLSTTEFQIAFLMLMERSATESTRLAQQLDAITASENRLAAQIDVQSDDLVRLQQLRREAEATRLLYESFLTRLKEMAVQQGLERSDSRVLSPAVPRLASSPKKAVIMVLSLILGSMVGAGLVLLREMRNNTLRTADELEVATGITVLGSIPKITGKERKDVLGYLRAKPTSVAAEAVRNLRTSLLLSNVDQEPQVIMSTSSVPGEGKTTQSLSLAQNMAGLGKKVIAIEGDLRRRVWSDYFDVPANYPSFLDVLSQKITLQDAIYSHPDMQTDLLFADASAINAADVYASGRFKAFIAELRGVYDYIIIDTPPVLAVPDARVIGQHVDAIIYTVLWDSTTTQQVKQGLQMLTSVGLKPTGLVLGQVDGKALKRYGYQGQYGYDGHTSGYYHN